MIDSAVSSAVTPPRSSPIGAAMRARSASATPEREQPLAPLRLRAARAHGADVAGVGAPSASASAASSSLGSWVTTAIAVARSIPPSRANASSGHAATTSSASGKRSAWAKRARGSTTNGRQPATRAIRHSAAAKSTAPKITSRGGGKVTSTNRSTSPTAWRRGALRPHRPPRRARRRRRPAPRSRAMPSVAPSAPTSSLAPGAGPRSDRDERAAAARRAASRAKRALRRAHGS